MRFTRFHFGIITTAVWIVLMCIAVGDPCRLLTMKLNELGDFLAGFFAPLAFLWLVLGYLQQGEELQHSTKALQLQAEELRNSVEQQRKLAEVSRQQWESEREAAKPLFVFFSGSGICADAESVGFYDVKNKGGDVKRVLACIEVPSKLPLKIIDEPFFGRSQTVKFNVRLSQMPTGALLKITYLDLLNNPGTCRYQIHKEDRSFFPSFKLVEE